MRSILVVLCFLISLGAQAQIRVIELELIKKPAPLNLNDSKRNVYLTANTEFKIELSKSLSEALHQGVTLNFQLDFELNKTSLTKIWNFVFQNSKPDNSVNFRLSFLKLTNSYRVQIEGIYQDFNGLDAALESIGNIRDWYLMPIDNPDLNYNGTIRLHLNKGKLPKLFRLNIFQSNDLDLDTGYVGVVTK